VSSTVNAAPPLLGFNLIPYAIAVAMPNWRLATDHGIDHRRIAIGAVDQDGIETSHPLHHDGGSGALGRGFAALATISFAARLRISVESRRHCRPRRSDRCRDRPMSFR